jgi:peptidyl-prolyl cis-trans isomerase C
MSASLKRNALIQLVLMSSMILTSCGLEVTPVPPSPTPTLVPTSTRTPVPLAVTVNGEEISAAEFEAELARYQEAQSGLGNSIDLDEARNKVMQDLVNSLLMEQGAESDGFIVDDAVFQDHIDTLITQLGGNEELSAWENSHGYTDDDFRLILRREIAAAWMRDQIIASVPATAEQVHVRQILLYNETEAQQAISYLQAGWDFIDLASKYDPVTRGELGWFPRGYLTSNAIEQAAFALQPGQYSSIIQDDTGYHILYLVERDLDHLLSPDALLTLQKTALANWLEQRWNNSTILYGPCCSKGD